MPSVDAERFETAVYLFGFVASADGGAPADAVDSDVLLVGDAGVALAASIVRARDYQPPPETAAAEVRIDWVAPLALHHHEVVQRLHASRTVVPLKFGALCPDMDHAATIVRRLQQPVAALLERFAGKDEWALRVTADRDAVAAAVRDARPGLTRLEQEAARMTAGAAYLARKRLAQVSADLVDQECDALAQRILDGVGGKGVEIARSPRHEPHAADAVIAVADAAILIDRRRFADLEARLVDLEDEYRPLGVTCQLRGPWPPYSFASTIDVADGGGVELPARSEPSS